MGKPEYIENQHELTTHRGIGKYSLSYNGCSAIAIYNMCEYYSNIKDIQPALYHPKWYYSLSEILSHINCGGVFFDGKFGAFPWDVSYVIKNCSYMVNKYFGWNWYNKIVEWNNRNKNNACILMYWSGNAVHYAFIENDLTIHNSYGETLDDIKNRLSNTLWPCILFRVNP